MKRPDGPYLIDPSGRAVTLAGRAVVFGRAEDCDIVLPDRGTSRRHAEIARIAEVTVLRDLGSTNGTWLNGSRITAPARLEDGDVIEISGARFTYRDPEATLETTHFPRLVVDDAAREVWVDRRPVKLSAEQHALISLLWSRRGRVCSKDEIARTVWQGYGGEIYDCQIESLVKRLRAKLEPDPAHPVLVVSVRGCGYRLVS